MREISRSFLAILVLITVTDLHGCSTATVQPPKSSVKTDSKPITGGTVTEVKVQEEKASEKAVTPINIAGEDGVVNSVGAFDKTVHPLTVKWCASCHGSTQAPLLGAADAAAAYDAIISTQKVDFIDASKSRLVLRLSTDQHNCPSDPGCQAASTQMQTAIQTWADAIKAAAKINTVGVVSDPLHLSDAKEQIIFGVNPEGVLAYFAPNFLIKSPMIAATDKGSGNQVFNTPATAAAATTSATATTDNTLGTAVVTATVTTAGVYSLFGLVNGPTATGSSFYIKVDGGDLNPWLFKSNAALFTWEKAAATVGGAPLSFQLTAGAHLIEIRQREPGAQLARLVLSTVATLDPSTAQATSRLGKLLRFDMSGPSKIPGAVVSIEVQDYATNAYLVLSPSVVVAKGSIYAKDLRFLINNTFLPQNATFTVVDKTIPAPGGPLSTAAMIAVKDQGADKDAFSISFANFEQK